MDTSYVISLGPLQIPLKLLLILIGIALSTVVSEKLARNKDWKKGEWTDLVVTFLFIVVMVYKFGWIIFDLKTVIQSPSSIIWTSSTQSMIYLGVILSLIIVTIRMFRKGYSLIDFLDFTWITISITFLLKELFIMDYGKVTSSFIGVSAEGNYLYHPINWYNAVLLAVLLIVRFLKFGKINKNSLMYLYVFLGVGLLMITLLDISIKLYYGLTIEQWTYITFAVTGSLGLMYWKKSS